MVVTYLLVFGYIHDAQEFLSIIIPDDITLIIKLFYPSLSIYGIGQNGYVYTYGEKSLY